jgi:hypothetical protein
MTTDNEAERGGSDGNIVTWRFVAGVITILILATGWYVLSNRVMGTKPGDAVGEALGVAFALLLVGSVLATMLGQSRRGVRGTGEAPEEAVLSIDDRDREADLT